MVEKKWEGKKSIKKGELSKDKNMPMRKKRIKKGTD